VLLSRGPGGWPPGLSEARNTTSRGGMERVRGEAREHHRNAWFPASPWQLQGSSDGYRAQHWCGWLPVDHFHRHPVVIELENNVFPHLLKPAL
jgi:hypothetical protein